mgnify:CR=1 FL=1
MFVFGSAWKLNVVYLIEMTIRIHEIICKCATNRICHFVVSRMIFGIFSHYYDIISFQNIYKRLKKINITFPYKFSILHGSIVDSLLKYIKDILNNIYKGKGNDSIRSLCGASLPCFSYDNHANLSLK